MLGIQYTLQWAEKVDIVWEVDEFHLTDVQHRFREVSWVQFIELANQILESVFPPRIAVVPFKPLLDQPNRLLWSSCR
jgi:hypothetical protein